MSKRSSIALIITIVLLTSAAALFLATGVALASDFEVNLITDTGADHELRWAIEQANLNPGSDQITFNIPGAGAHVISPAAALPDITGPVSINGFSQPGASPADGGPAVIKIVIDGSLAGPFAVDGLRFALGSSGSTVSGLSIGNFGGVGVVLDGVSLVHLHGNNIGVDAAGTGDTGNSGGVDIKNGAASNVIGGTGASDRNVISGNGSNGVSISDSAGNTVSGNYIGLDATGQGALQNASEGVSITNASDTDIGGDTQGEGNCISKNGRSGINIGGVSSDIRIKGNHIGLDATGGLDRGNNMDGIRASGVSGITIGGTTTAERNVVSGNGMFGGINLSSCTSATIRGNYIGTDVTGTLGIGNTEGIYISMSNGTVVGGASAGNTISYNDQHGIFIRDTADCQVVENRVKSNGAAGVTVDGATSLRNRISRNSIYRNGSPGIELLNGGNAGYAPPAFGSAGYNLDLGNVTVSGTAPANATVEFYSTGSVTDPGGSGQGLVYLGTATAGAGGAFSATLSGLTGGDHVSATATSPASHPSGAGNTSQFAANALMVRPAPTVTSVTPDTGVKGTTENVTNLTGTGFWGAPTVQLIGPAAGGSRNGAGIVTADDVSVASSTKVTCSFNLVNAEEGSYSLTVANADGKNATLPNAFTIESSQHTWYLAEGTTAWGFSTYITIANDDDSDLTCRVTYMPAGSATVAEDVALPAKSQTTLTNDHLLTVMGGSKDFSTKVECTDHTKTIAVDRTMTWTGGSGGGPGTGTGEEAHCSVGVTSPAITWYLPEGSSGWGFETWTLVQNPGAQPANVTLTYMTDTGESIPVSYQVPSGSRASFNMAADIGARDASIMVTSDVPVIPERAMYRNARREGHDSIGTTTPATDYYLAEGTTGWGFTTFVLIQNPNPEAATVTVVYNTTSGAKPQAPFSLAGNSRSTIKVNDIAEMANTDFSTTVSADKAIIAERAMYWDSGTGETCHDSIGMASPHTNFYLPDGQSSDGRETWTLVQNPNETEVTVEITYLPAGGGDQVVKTETIPGASRKTFGMLEHSGITGRASITATCTTLGKKIMVERAMYWDSRGAGTDTIGGYSD